MAETYWEVKLITGATSTIKAAHLHFFPSSGVLFHNDDSADDISGRGDSDKIVCFIPYNAMLRLERKEV